MTILKNVEPTLKSLIDDGLYVDNLRKMESLSKGLILLGVYPTVFYTLQHVCFELRIFWKDRSVSIEDYEYVQTQLKEPLQNVLTSVESGLENDSILEQLDSLIREFIKVQFYLQKKDH
jgi:hypothetical protein